MTINVAISLAIALAASADALFVHRASQAPAAKAPAAQAPATFTGYYDQKKTGRGVWKWNNAIVAYQRHFAMLVGKPLIVAEVGVQSGGSMAMWRDVLGSQVLMHGLDIAPACQKFEGPNVSITIGDQADWNMWQVFFTTKANKGLDILVDDGGHEPHQMDVTLKAAFPHIHAGGFISIEDITVCPQCPPYLQGFFQPAANFLAEMANTGLIDSVHLYPMLLVVRKGGFKADSPQAKESVLKYAGKQIKVGDWVAMGAAIDSAPAGSHILIQNKTWPTFFTSYALYNFFSSFYQLHDVVFKDTPAGCSNTADAVCTNDVTPLKHLQIRVSGVHIYKDHAVIEVPAKAPQIAAIRRGTNWSSECR